MGYTTPYRLLLVEPDALLADLTSFRLELLAYQLQCVKTAAEAFEAIQAAPPDLVMVNSKLPDFDGIEFVAKLRHDWSPDQLPALVLSFESTLELVERAFLAGSQDYLVIPFDPQVLEDKIQRLLGNRRLAVTS